MFSLTNYYFNIQALPGLIVGLFTFLMGVFVITQKNRSIVNTSFFFLCLSVGVWLVATALGCFSSDESIAAFWFRIDNFGVLFISINTYFFTRAFLNLKPGFTTYVGYLLALILGFIELNTNWLVVGAQKFFWGYFPKWGFFSIPVFLVFFGYMFISFYILIRVFLKNKLAPLKKNQVKYLIIGYLIGYTGAVDFLPAFGITIYPFGCFSFLIFLSIIAYAIVRYRLLDIRVAISRFAIFCAVYTLFLGIPLFLFYNLLGGWGIWLMPFVILTIFATGGPSIYIYFQRKAEDRILREDRKAQQLLTRASEDMTTIRDLKKLLNLIVYLVSKQMKVKNSSIYLLDKDTNSYLVKAARLPSRVQNLEPIDRKDPLVEHIHKVRLPLVYEELKMQAQTEYSQNISECETQMRKMNAALIVPAFIGDFLIGFLIVDERRDSRAYSQEALNVLQVLANQAALAIENAIFFEERGKTLAETFHERNLRSIGTLGAGVGHQINNRFNAISVPAQVASYKIEKKPLDKLSAQELKELILFSKKALDAITQDALRGGKIATSLTSFSKKTEGYRPVSFAKIIEEVLNLLSCKFHLNELNLTQEIPKDTPPLWGNLSQLAGVFFNLLDNAHDALKIKQRELQAGNLEGKLEDYEGKVELKTWEADKQSPTKKKMLTITVEDNGIGMTPEQVKQLFIPFFTTKATAGKGTGLGLWVIKQIVEAHGGTIGVESEYGKGTKFTINLPLATQEQIKSSKKGAL